MKKYFVLDTNIFLRFLIKDNKPQFEKAKAIFTGIEKGEISGRVSILVVNEIIWVLENFYGLKRAIYIPQLLSLFALKNIKVIEVKKSLIVRILQKMMEVRYDFTDLYLSEMAPKENILSFDKDFAKIGRA